MRVHLSSSNFYMILVQLYVRTPGTYNSCMHLCKYCYANANHNLVKTNYQKHNPFSPFLIGELEKELMVEDGFIRCNSSYLVNIHNVRSIKGNDVEMSNSHLLAISQSKRKNFLLALSKV